MVAGKPDVLAFGSKFLKIWGGASTAVSFLILEELESSVLENLCYTKCIWLEVNSTEMNEFAPVEGPVSLMFSVQTSYHWSAYIRTFMYAFLW